MRSEPVLPERATLTPAQQQQSVMTHIPLLNKMKRKRGNSSPPSPRLDPPPVKRTTDTMSHVEIPTLDVQRPGLLAQEDQLNERHHPLHHGAISEQGPVSSAAHLQRDNGPPGNLAQDERSSQIGLDNSYADVSISSPSSAAMPMDVRQTIGSQFGLEILLKHKELRLIDQEFAKCQIALEQLRRCQIIPYPAMSFDNESLRIAVGGSGPAVNNEAPLASPWGVSDGPYSRHYQRWLIPDSVFDDTAIGSDPIFRSGGKTLPDRVTRGSKVDQSSVASKSRSHRGSNSARLKALPHGYPEPKEEKGPMIVKRSSDRRMVKLVCLDCRRSNFNSAQGFINHCRIAHSRQFLSHDAAIEASGEEVDLDIEGGVLGEVDGPQGAASAGLVHPLIRSHSALTDTSKPSPSSSLRRRKLESTNVLAETPRTHHRATTSLTNFYDVSCASSNNAAPFNPCPQTPHLSALFAQRGRGGDLNQFVTEAKREPDVDLAVSSDEDDDEAEEGAIAEIPQSRSTRGVVRGGDLYCCAPRSPRLSESSSTLPAFAALPDRSGFHPNIHAHPSYPSTCHADNHTQQGHNNVLMLDSNTPLNLSPNTIESHTAPSLVSDDGDYENTHSESETPSSVGPDDEDDHYIHAAVIDHDGMDLGEGSSAAADHHLAFGGKPHGPPGRRGSSVMRPKTAIRDDSTEERHVTFASPVRKFNRGSKAKDEK